MKSVVLSIASARQVQKNCRVSLPFLLRAIPAKFLQAFVRCCYEVLYTPYQLIQELPGRAMLFCRSSRLKSTEKFQVTPIRTAPYIPEVFHLDMQQSTPFRIHQSELRRQPAFYFHQCLPLQEQQPALPGHVVESRFLFPQARSDNPAL